jgi:TPR repeat protein
MGTDIRIDEDFELAVADGLEFKTLYIRVEENPSKTQPEIPADELRKLAVEGSVDAQIGWARRLLHGHGVPRDEEAAYRWFRLAARSGDADALNMVGRCYEVGWGVPQDPEEAVRWFRYAADKEHGWAQYNLGKLLARGHGGNRDPKVALSLLVRSARHGVPKAMNMLGRYREGSNVPRWRERSARLWYRWAAERDCFRGQFHYGRYLVAEGRLPDGKRWFRTSLSHAPAQYCEEVLEILSAHPSEELREFAAEMIAERRKAK